MTNFIKALQLKNENKSKVYHTTDLCKADYFLKIMRDRCPDIQMRVNNMLKKQVENNLIILRSVAETIVLCGQQNIDLRGHQDYVTDYLAEEYSTSGHFLSLLEFRAQSGDTSLKEHLTHCCKNAKYTSSVIQYELIQVIGDSIRNQLIEKVTLS